MRFSIRASIGGILNDGNRCMTESLNFRQTWLWRQAFETPRADSSLAEQEYFRRQFTLMREKAAQLASRIAVDLPGMTVHDISHLDALWDTASLVAEGAINLNPAEAFVFGAAILLHDAGMSLGAFPGGLDDVKKTVVWRDAVARRILEINNDTDEAINGYSLTDEFTNALIPDVLRRLHAEQAERLAEQNWEIGGTSYHLIDDPDLRSFYGPTIGQIAHSHWWPISKVETELSGELGALPQRTKHIVDKVKLACLLRIADALHIDSRRAPKYLRAITKPSGISALHWEFQERLSRPYVELDTVVFTTGQPFDRENADAWWLAFDTLSLIDRELNDVDQLLRSRGKEVLRVRRVKGAGSPEMLSRTVKTRDWRPVDARLQVSDVPRIVETLGGSKLYGNDPTVPLRELIQNAADAVQARRRFEGRSDDWGKIIVAIEKRDDGYWLTVEDNGIGMSELVLTGPLLDFGTSFWRSPIAMEEFPGLLSSGMNAIGRFGIGFFSVFMLGSAVNVFSRRCDRGAEHGRLLEFRGGTSARPVLAQPGSKILPIDGGTRVEVRLDHDPFSDGGLLHTKRQQSKPIALSALVGSLAPNLSVALYVRIGNSEKRLTKPGDWLKISDQRLVARLGGVSEVAGSQKDKLMRPMKNSQGQVVGRGAVVPEDSWTFRTTGGWITIAGLRATRMRNIAGVVLGEPLTASRDTALPLIDDAGLAAWATEQADLVSKHVKDDETQAKAAEVVLGCGGEIGKLKVARWGSEWLDQHEFFDRVLSRYELVMSLDGDFHYEEDTDDVLPRDFNNSFVMDKDVVIVPRHEGSVVKNTTTLWPTPREQPVGSKSSLATFIMGIITKAWGGQAFLDNDTRQVGDVNGARIDRYVDIAIRDTDDSAET